MCTANYMLSYTTLKYFSYIHYNIKHATIIFSLHANVFLHNHIYSLYMMTVPNGETHLVQAVWIDYQAHTYVINTIMLYIYAIHKPYHCF